MEYCETCGAELSADNPRIDCYGIGTCGACDNNEPLDYDSPDNL